jgi:hypothetical protein
VALGWAERCVDQPEDAHSAQRYSTAPESAAVARATAALGVNPKLLTQTKNLTDLTALECKLTDLQNAYVQQLSWQRRAVASKFSPLRSFSFPSVGAPSGAADMLWTEEQALLLVWADGDALTLVRIIEDQVQRTSFAAPNSSEWRFPKFYSASQVCVLLVHEGGPASVCLLSIQGWHDGQLVGPDEYGFFDHFIAQQLPLAFSSPDDMQVSSTRGLCSIKAAGRLLTLDLEADGEEEEDGGSESSASSIAPPARRRNLRKHDSLLAGFENTDINASRSSSGKSSPEQVAQRLKFSIQ